MTAPRTLYDWFAAGARRDPDAVAVEAGDTALTYGALEDLAARIAGRLGAGPARVGLLGARTAATYAGYLAILRSGAAVVPLSAVNPPARSRAVLAAAGAAVVLVDPQAPAFDPPPGVRALRLDEAATGEPRTGAPAGDRDDLAYVMFTSGSTGRPKGVPIAHRNVVDFIGACVDRYEVGPGSRLTQTFELTFDPSVFDLFVSWGGGGTLVVPTTQDVIDPVGFVNARRVTHWFSTPSAVTLAGLLGALPPGSMPGLRWSLFGGEQLTVAQARMWADAAPGSAVENLYGPTETTITVTAYRLPADRAAWPRTANHTVPVGRAGPYAELVLLDASGRPATTGELCVRGPQRFAGYLDPDADAGRFVRLAAGGASAVDRPGEDDWYRTGDRMTLQDGELVHLGRFDQQLKVRGQRIEPGEVESALRAEPDVADAVVVAAPGIAGIELVAFVTGPRLDVGTLGMRMRQVLPRTVVPDRFVELDTLPLNASGKVDRAGLAERLRRDTGRPA